MRTVAAFLILILMWFLVAGSAPVNARVDGGETREVVYTIRMEPFVEKGVYPPPYSDPRLDTVFPKAPSSILLTIQPDVGAVIKITCRPEKNAITRNHLFWIHETYTYPGEQKPFYEDKALTSAPCLLKKFAYTEHREYKAVSRVRFSFAAPEDFKGHFCTCDRTLGYVMPRDI